MVKWLVDSIKDGGNIPKHSWGFQTNVKLQKYLLNLSSSYYPPSPLFPRHPPPLKSNSNLCSSSQSHKHISQVDDSPSFLLWNLLPSSFKALLFSSSSTIHSGTSNILPSKGRRPPFHHQFRRLKHNGPRNPVKKKLAESGPTIES